MSERKAEKRCIICGEKISEDRRASGMKTCKACGGLYERGHGFGKVPKWGE